MYTRSSLKQVSQYFLPAPSVYTTMGYTWWRSAIQSFVPLFVLRLWFLYYLGHFTYRRFSLNRLIDPFRLLVQSSCGLKSN